MPQSSRRKVVLHFLELAAIVIRQAEGFDKLQIMEGFFIEDHQTGADLARFFIYCRIFPRTVREIRKMIGALSRENTARTQS